MRDQIFHRADVFRLNDPHSSSIRIYWEDTDAGGVVYYANYLKFFERTRTEWLRTLGVQQHALQDLDGVIFVVAEAQVKYLVPARLDDLLVVNLQIVDSGRASMWLEQQAWRGDTLLVQARFRIGCVDAKTLHPRRLPEQVSKQLILHTSH